MQINVQSDVSLTANTVQEGQLTSYSLSWDNAHVKEDSKITFTWEIPLKDILYRWYPGIEQTRGVLGDWREENLTQSSIAANAPMVCFYNQKGENKYTVAISEFKKITAMNFGVCEKSSSLSCYIALPLMQFRNSGISETEFSIRIDADTKPMEDAILGVSQWWEGFAAATDTPSYARDTMYSFWYSYHQDINPEVVEAECELVKELGIGSVIVDDGWQTTDNNGGYAYCGDWKPLKFPNMKEHVERVHRMGLKYILWYSVPFLGLKAESYPLFKDKALREIHGAAVLDPRYREVREYLIQTYEKALRDWNLDGFKLDFIDEFKNENNIPANDRMDIKDLSDAVFTLMTDIRTRLRAIKEDVVIEFRQTYIGPAMRSYGDFFRVGDCPNDFLRNRVNSLDLRLFCGLTPIHSDMIMWHKEESVENCALQIINAMFSVIQLSVRLKEQNENQRRMLKFWLKFLKDNKQLLQLAPLRVSDSQSLYTMAEGVGETEKLSAVFVPDKCVLLNKNTVTLVNGTQNGSVLLEAEDAYTYEILDCMGNQLASAELSPGLHRIAVPSAGVMIAKRKD